MSQLHQRKIKIDCHEISLNMKVPNSMTIQELLNKMAKKKYQSQLLKQQKSKEQKLIGMLTGSKYQVRLNTRTGPCVDLKRTFNSYPLQKDITLYLNKIINSINHSSILNQIEQQPENLIKQRHKQKIQTSQNNQPKQKVKESKQIQKQFENKYQSNKSIKILYCIHGLIKNKCQIEIKQKQSYQDFISILKNTFNLPNNLNFRLVDTITNKPLPFSSNKESISQYLLQNEIKQISLIPQYQGG